MKTELRDKLLDAKMPVDENGDKMLVIIVEPDGDSYHAYAPALKGLHVDGETPAEAISNAIMAALYYAELPS